MRQVKERVLPNGHRRVTVDLRPDETLVAIDPNHHYQLGQPLEDMVLRGYHLADARPVSWCVVEQKWRD